MIKPFTIVGYPHPTEEFGEITMKTEYLPDSSMIWLAQMPGLKEVMDERNRQDLKWGEQDHPNLYWLGILGEEMGEICKDVIEGKSPRKELVQVVAVGLAWLRAMDQRDETEEGYESLLAVVAHQKEQLDALLSLPSDPKYGRDAEWVAANLRAAAIAAAEIDV